MSYVDPQIAVEVKLRAEFDEVPIVVENQDIHTQGEFLLWQFIPTSESRVDMGASNGRYRVPVTLFGQLYSDRDVGYQAAQGRADKIAKIFRGKTVGGVVIQSCGVQKAAGEDQNAGFYQLNIVGTGYFDFFEDD